MLPGRLGTKEVAADHEGVRCVSVRGSRLERRSCTSRAMACLEFRRGSTEELRSRFWVVPVVALGVEL